MAIFDEISVKMQLAMGRKSVDEFIDEAITSDSAGTLSVLIKKPEVVDRIDAILEQTIKKGAVKAFKFVAGAQGEDKFNKSTLKGSHLPSQIAKSGNIDMVRALAELGYDLNTPSPEGKTLAFIALEEGKTELFKFLVEAIRKQDQAAYKSGKKKPEENALDACFRDVPTLMELAIKEQRLDEVKLLLANGASPNQQQEDLSGLGRIERMRRAKAGKKGYVQMAIEAQAAPMIEMLAEAKADLNPPGICLLEVALGFPDMSIVKLLARKMGKDAVNAARDEMGNSMLNRAVLDNNLPIAEFFMTLPGADLAALNFKHVTPLCEAANNTRLDLVELLMKNGVSINQHVNPETRQTLLHNAVLNQNVNLAQWLMHRAIDVNAVDAHGHTALDLAVTARHMKLIELIVDSDRTDINSGATKPEAGQTMNAGAGLYRRPPLVLGVQLMLDAADLHEMNTLADVVILLIDLQADVNAQDSNGVTALHLMARELDKIKAQWGARADRAPNVRRILKALIKAGCDPNIADCEGKRAIDYARQGAQDLKVLFESGDIEIQAPEAYATGEATFSNRAGVLPGTSTAPGSVVQTGAFPRQTPIPGPTQTGSFPRPAPNPTGTTGSFPRPAPNPTGTTGSFPRPAPSGVGTTGAYPRLSPVPVPAGGTGQTGSFPRSVTQSGSYPPATGTGAGSGGSATRIPAAAPAQPLDPNAPAAAPGPSGSQRVRMTGRFKFGEEAPPKSDDEPKAPPPPSNT